MAEAATRTLASSAEAIAQRDAALARASAANHAWAQQVTPAAPPSDPLRGLRRPKPPALRGAVRFIVPVAVGEQYLRRFLDTSNDSLS